MHNFKRPLPPQRLHYGHLSAIVAVARNSKPIPTFIPTDIPTRDDRGRIASFGEATTSDCLAILRCAR